MFKANKAVLPHHIPRKINEVQWDFMANIVADTVAAYSELAKVKGHERVNAVVTGQTTCLVDMVNAKNVGADPRVLLHGRNYYRCSE